MKFKRKLSNKKNILQQNKKILKYYKLVNEVNKCKKCEELLEYPNCPACEGTNIIYEYGYE